MPAKRLWLWGMSRPPSDAPLRAAKTRWPVVVVVTPTSSRHLKGLLSSSSSSTKYVFLPASVDTTSPSGSSLPSYNSSKPTFCSKRLAHNKPVAYAAAKFFRPFFRPYLGNSLEVAVQMHLSPTTSAQWTDTVTKRFETRTTNLYLAVPYLFLSCVIRRLRGR